MGFGVAMLEKSPVLGRFVLRERERGNDRERWKVKEKERGKEKGKETGKERERGCQDRNQSLPALIFPGVSIF